MVFASIAMILPTGGGMETAIAFQRTDIAAAILALALIGLAAAVWNSSAGIIIGAIGVGVAFAGLSLIAGNPLLGGLARLYIFVGPGLALGLGLILRLASLQAPHLRAPKLKQPMPPQPAAPVTPAPAASPNVESATVKAAAPQTSEIQTELTSDAAGTSTSIEMPTSEEQTEPKVTLSSTASDEPVLVPKDAVNLERAAADPYVDEDAKNRLEFLKMRAAETEDATTAAALWRKIADEYPDYHPAMNAEAQLLFQLGRIPEGRARLEASLLATPVDPATLSLAARYAANDKDFPAAEQYWAEAFKSHDMNDGQAAAYINA